MLSALWWWLVVQVIALCATPLCLALFRPLADRGYALSKAFGLLLFGYVTWLLVVSRLLENNRFTLLLALALIAGGSYLIWRRDGEDLKVFWRRRRGLLLLEEAIFLGAYLGFLVIRMRNADIAGTEKFMDFAFLNAITRSASFPPLDPWLAPSPAVPSPTINYYYFGYLIQGLLLQLTGVLPAAGFNLALCLLFGLTATGIFGLAYGASRDLLAEAVLRRSSPRARPSDLPPESNRRLPSWAFKAARPYVATGALAVYLLLIAGNLWTALRRFDGSGLWEKDFWQGIGWNATRVLVIRQNSADVDYTINEFPAFSFLLGDLHPHVLALPFVILAVGLAYNWLLRPPQLYRWAVAGEPLFQGTLATRRDRLWWLRPAYDLLPGAMILGSLYFLNSWDFPSYFLLAQAAALAGAWWLRRRVNAAPPRAGPRPRRQASAQHSPASTARREDPSPVTEPPGPAIAVAEDALPLPTGEALATVKVATRFQVVEPTRPLPVGEGVREWGLRSLAAVAVAGALAALLFLPFILTFKPPVIAAESSRLLSLPLGVVAQRSLLGQFLQFWGAQLLLLAPATIAGAGALPFFQRSLDRTSARARATTIIARAAPGWAPAALVGGGLLLALLAERFGAGVLVLALLFAAGAGWAALHALDPDTGGGRPLAFAFGTICLAALLLAACEVIYIRDFYGGALRRMNTVFKFYYQAWLLFAAGGSVATFWLFRRLRRGRGRLPYATFVVASALLLGATVLYPYRATILRTNGFQNPPTLDGMDWMRRFHPDDYAAAQWLREHGAARAGTRAPVLLEASGGPYSEYARMATQTGFPTILGWDQHQRLWRGATINTEIDTRKREIDLIYTSATMAEAQPLLDKYRVSYIIVGYLENAPDKYGASPGLVKFDTAAQAGTLEIVFRQGQTTIYWLRRNP